MQPFFARLSLRASFVDELLSDAFEALPGQKSDADAAARRLAAWCRSCAGGDWAMFARRLERDGLSIAHVLAKFATVRRSARALPPAWIEDAIWIDAVLQGPSRNAERPAAVRESQPFEQLFAPAVQQAEALLCASLDARAADNLDPSALACLRLLLLKELCSVAAPAIYERFSKLREASTPAPGTVDPERHHGTLLYDQFIAQMRGGGFRLLFEDKPVLLRLIAAITRQWIDSSREFVMRLDADLGMIRRALLGSDSPSQVAAIQGALSDPHNGGRSVRILTFADGSRVLYKPKDLRVDVAWHALVERLNRGGAPIELKAARALARDGYGWSEFIAHTGCADAQGCARFYRRAGAWLALFHCFAATDMHQENMIAAGEHPVPVDLEMILQGAAEMGQGQPVEAQAFQAAREAISNSVMGAGLLPAYGRSPENKIVAIGGVAAESSGTRIAWHDINSDKMRPAKAKDAASSFANLPHVQGRYARVGDRIDDFVSGFEEYAKFLMRHTGDTSQGGLFDGFAGSAVRKVIRPTMFYSMLLQRLKDHRTMADGIVWSAQADFQARLADWETESDPLWPLQRAERAALLALNVPHFVMPTDGSEIRDAGGACARTEVVSGLDRARARVRRLDEQNVAWQIEVIRQNTGTLSSSRPTSGSECMQRLRTEEPIAPAKGIFIAEADAVAAELSQHAFRRGQTAAWIGREWLGDSEVSQLVALGQDLYNGLCGIALFLAAHACVMRNQVSQEMALAAVCHVRKNLKSRNSARMARSLGIGGATGLGSVVYALTTMSNCLRDEELLADAHVAAELFTDDLIEADQHLDVVGGSAGAILGLLRLHRDTGSDDVLRRAIKCGVHLLARPRVGPTGCRSWRSRGSALQPLNGMSHGAAGFAYALFALAASTGRDEFAHAASECIAFENASYDAARGNWPDLRNGGEAEWPLKWCHGAPGVGLARIGASKTEGLDRSLVAADIANVLAGSEQAWPGEVDSLCCGTLGHTELIADAGSALGRSDLRELASRRLMAIVQTAARNGDYRWAVGTKQFNLGLFHGLAGVGYTCLRRVDPSLPNVLIWE